jgi:hypothetical protein
MNITKCMRTFNPLALILLLTTSTSILNLSCASEPTMHIVKTDEGYQFYENDNPILFYRTKPLTTDAGTHSRSDYCHPLLGLDGEIMTEDFPEDHLHHRGIFWAWHQVYAGKQLIRDMWECTDFIWDFKKVTINNSANDQASLTATVHWKSSRWQNGSAPLAEEKVTIRLHKTENQIRLIDFDIHITPLVDSLSIGGSEDDKGYGGFSTRIPLPDDLQMTDMNGEVTPQRTAVAAGDWINFSGTYGKQKSGFAVFIHPTNPGIPRRWILRKKGSCQNVAYPGREPVAVTSEHPLDLKYRIVLHKNADLEKLFNDYAGK